MTIFDIRDHGGSFSGGQGLNKDDKLALVNITNNAESNDSVLKDSFVGAVNTAYETPILQAGSDTSWMNILDAIPLFKEKTDSIKSEMLNIVTGTGVTTNANKVFNSSILSGSGSGTKRSYVQVDVDLGFSPLFIQCEYVIYDNIYSITYVKNSVSYGQDSVRVIYINGTGGVPLGHIFKANERDGYVTDKGFCLPLYNETTADGYVCKWTAIG